ncbi:mesothelin-like [Leptodactylus fuscus]|uniref:mesothelin-like n=1 Tax=Leptodactylus fuscus TaxID=238119 RepID=UPI003F4EFD3A
MYYAKLLTIENPNFPIENIPQNILCYAISTLNIGIINGSQALNTLKLLKTCNVTLDQQALSGLLPSSSEITSDTLASLGSLAVGLPTSTIQKLNGSVLVDNISNLSAINGWSVAQASTIVKKVLNTNYMITVQSLKNLGSLIIGLPSSKLDILSSSDILTLANNSKFTTYMEQAPLALKQRFVQKVIQASYTENVFQSVPANLASEIPASKLITSTLDISKINQMKFMPSQAQVLFQTVITQVTNYSILSSNVLQGFTCGAAKNITNDQFVSLTKSMTGKSVNLGSSQLRCLANRLSKNGAPADFANYSSEILLYLGPYNNPSQCKDYFTRVGQANIDLLVQEKRVALLNSARTCLNISSASKITKDTLQTLGSLVCDLPTEEITNSDPYIVQALQSCSSFTDPQKTAILQKLKSVYGNPSSWTSTNMEQIGTLSSTFDSNTLANINSTIKRQFFQGFLKTTKSQHKTIFTYVMSQLKVSARPATRATSDCEELTTEKIAKQQEYIVISYTAAQLDACINNITVKDNLEILGSLDFNTDQLNILKNKLNLALTPAVPEEYLFQIGNIARMYSTKEISQWNVTSVDTLAAVLEDASWQTNDSKINALVTQYLKSPSATLDGTALTVLAPYICGLDETLISIISENDLQNSTKPLDTSTCTQNQKDLLYKKMRTAYLSFQNYSNAYYQIMSTVLGGAPFGDLQLFAKIQPEMDLTTFTELNPNEVKKLSAQNIKDLLGNNVLDIKTISNSSVVQAWLSVNSKPEVNNLGLNETAGVPEKLPDDFIVIIPVPQKSGASPLSFVYLLYTCTLVAIFYINNLFL